MGEFEYTWLSDESGENASEYIGGLESIDKLPEPFEVFPPDQLQTVGQIIDGLDALDQIGEEETHPETTKSHSQSTEMTSEKPLYIRQAEQIIENRFKWGQGDAMS